MNKAPKEFLLRLQGQGGGGREGYTRYICTYIYGGRGGRSLGGDHRALALSICVNTEKISNFVMNQNVER